MLLGSTKVTTNINISWNQFAFDFGKVKLPKIRSLTLDVSHNKIYGHLPVVIENVLSLNVSYNMLCGEIPKGDDENNNDHDAYMYIHNKYLCGSPLSSCKWSLLLFLRWNLASSFILRKCWLNNVFIFKCCVFLALLDYESFRIRGIVSSNVKAWKQFVPF